MLSDNISYRDLVTSDDLKNHRFLSTFVRRCVAFIEHLTKAQLVVNARNLGERDPAMFTPLKIARALERSGIILGHSEKSTHFPDEPILPSWSVRYGHDAHGFASGTALEHRRSALYAALAEAVERVIWTFEDDYFQNERIKTVAQMRADYTTFIPPTQFTAFSEAQRSQERYAFSDTTPFSWIEGFLLTKNQACFVPTQTVSPRRGPKHIHREPLIREQVTSGLATWSSYEGAELRGMLELIERDAFMVWWFNQLLLPVHNPTPLIRPGGPLARLLAKISRYQLELRVYKLPTDAPTTVLMVVLEDMSGSPHNLRYAFGLCAHYRYEHALEHALAEALRARVIFRTRHQSGATWNQSADVDHIGHFERIDYWGVPEHAEKLQPLFTGNSIEHPTQETWSIDSDETHRQRLITWCQQKNFDCLRIDLSSSKKNQSPWKIVFMVIPELHHIHLREQRQHLNPFRLHSVPQAYGLTPRPTPFTKAPHPFL